jgi:hypothetical protein
MPDLKMMVLTDAWLSTKPDAAGDYLKAVTQRRHDIMFTGSTNWEFANDTVVDSFPAAYPQVVAFSSVNVNFTSTPSSGLVNYTAFAAPGEYVMWTTPIDQFYKEASAYGQRANSISVTPPLEGLQADLWDSPPPGTITGSATGSVTAGFVDCGKGFEPCANATVSVNVINAAHVGQGSGSCSSSSSSGSRSSGGDGQYLQQLHSDNKSWDG